MSRAYRVTWLNSSRTVTAHNSLRLRLEILAILPEGDMHELLREELLRDGWVEQEDGSLELVLEGLSARLPKGAKEITLSAESRARVDARGLSEGEVSKALDTASERAQTQLQDDVGLRLTKAEPTLRVRVDAVVQRLYLRALQRKAASLGEIESVREEKGQDGEYEVVIKVKI